MARAEQLLKENIPKKDTNKVRAYAQVICFFFKKQFIVEKNNKQKLYLSTKIFALSDFYVFWWNLTQEHPSNSDASRQLLIPSTNRKYPYNVTQILQRSRILMRKLCEKNAQSNSAKTISLGSHCEEENIWVLWGSEGEKENRSEKRRTNPRQLRNRFHLHQERIGQIIRGVWQN